MEVSDTAQKVLDTLCQMASSPGIAEVPYSLLDYQIPGYTESASLSDQIIEGHPLSQLEARSLVEIVEDKNAAHIYIPRFLLMTTEENRMRADQLRLMPYPDYLETWEWIQKKRLVRLRDSNSCTRCGLCVDVRELHVHHNTYERRGIERLSDLTTLCSRCHYDAHRWELEATS